MELCEIDESEFRFNFIDQKKRGFLKSLVRKDFEVFWFQDRFSSMFGDFEIYSDPSDEFLGVKTLLENQLPHIGDFENSEFYDIVSSCVLEVMFDLCSLQREKRYIIKIEADNFSDIVMSLDNHLNDKELIDQFIKKFETQYPGFFQRSNLILKDSYIN